MKLTQELYYGYNDKDGVRYFKAVVSHLDGEAEALFLSPLAHQKGNVLEVILERCLLQLEDEFGNICKDSKSKIIQNLAAGDVNLLLLAISSATHEDTRRVLNPQCPKCHKLNNIQFDVEKDLKYNKPTSVPPKRCDISIGDRVFTLEWLPLFKITNLSKECMETVENQSFLNEATLRNKMIRLATKSILHKGKSETLEDVPGPMLSKLISKWQEEASYGVDLEVSCRCFDCGHPWQQNIVQVVTEEGKPGGLWHFFGSGT